MNGFSIANLIAGIPLDRILLNDGKIWINKLRVGDTVLAGKSKPTALNISTRGIFLCLSFTGSYTTMDNGDPAVDNGVCRMSMKISNSSGRVYIPDPIFLHNLFSPGRVKSAADLTGEPSNQLQIDGTEWVTIFRPNDVITHDVQNDSDYDNDWEMSYTGIWIIN